MKLAGRETGMNLSIQNSPCIRNARATILLTMVRKANSINAACFPIHRSIHNTRLQMKYRHPRVRESQRIPQSEDRQLADAVRSEPRPEVEMGGGRGNLHDSRVGHRVPEERLCDVQRARDVDVEGVEECVAVYVCDRVEGADDGGAAD
jgi:hypothetical protein